jgi:uncharacterized protein YgbK (DUF1537 family)
MAATLIADDLTGACDAGALFAGRGTVGVFVDAAAVDPARDVAAVDTETRALPAVEAAARVRAAAERLGPRLRAGLLFKKIDSTFRGAVGDELDALLSATRRPTALVCPAFPAQGRTVAGGCLRVHGTPVHASAIGRDPAYPGDTSDVVAILRRAIPRPVSHLPLDRVRGGADVVQRALAAAGGGIIVADAETDADLDALAGAAAAWPEVVLAGSAGLAAAIAARLGHAALPVPLPAGRGWLIVAGSLHPATRAQIRALEAAGVGSVAIDGTREPDTRALADRLRDGRPVLVTTADAAPAGPGAGRRMAASLAAVATGVIARAHPDLVVVAGGDTAHALIVALAADRLELRGSPSSGLALGDLVVDGAPRFAVLTKAGGFGAADLFLTLLEGRP